LLGKPANYLKLPVLFQRSSSRQRELKQYLKSHWGIKASDISWYERALRHKSIIGAGKFCHGDCNERLELLGDAVLDTVVTEVLFYRFPDANEGTLTKVRSRIVNRQTLGEIGLRANLDSVIEARIGAEDSKDKIVGNALEAWLGAIYLDKGFEASKKCVETYLLHRYLNLEEVINNPSDYKSQMIEWAQQKKINFEFRTVANMDDPNSFICDIYIDGKKVASSNQRSKKRAEKDAAKHACDALGLSKNVEA
jgi:ribonuclease III